MVVAYRENTVQLNEFRKVTFVRIINGHSGFLDVNFKQLTKDVCISVLKKHPVLHEINDVVIGIHDSYDWSNADEQLKYIEQRALSGKDPKKALGQVMRVEVNRGEYRIHVYIDIVYEIAFGLVNGNRNRLDRAFMLKVRDTILHEGTHLWQLIMSGESKRLMKTIRKIRKNLKAKLKRTKIPGWKKKYVRPLVNLRVDELDFIGRLQAEGLAKFVEERLHGRLPLDVNTAYKLYIYAERSVNKVIETINLGYELMSKYIEEGDRLKLKETADNIHLYFLKNREIYDIGLHMVYTLYALGKFEFEDIGKMSHLGFIREYEDLLLSDKIPESIKMVPLVSIENRNGLKGTLGYNTIIKQWLSLVGKLKHYNIY